MGDLPHDWVLDVRVEWVASGHGPAGLDRGVLYLADGTGVPWNGLTGATEQADETIQTDIYYDGVRFAFAQGREDFGLTLESWTYPPEFEDFVGLVGDIQTRQPRRPFGFVYRVDMNGYYELHLVWNAKASANEKPYSSKNNEFEISIFEWNLVTTPKRVAGIHPTAHFVVNTELAPAAAVEALENLLYGTDLTDPALPEPQEVIDLFLDHAVLVVTDNGDGTVTVTGPDEAIQYLSGIKVRIKWPSVRYYKGGELVNIRSM